MRVTVTITIDMPSPQQWNTAYGCGSSLSDIRADVKQYAADQVMSAPPFEAGEVDAKITWK